MYTGIVQANLPIDTVTRKPGLLTFALTLPLTLSDAVTEGGSIAVNGCCFTVTHMQSVETGLRVTFDAIQETLDLTNIRLLEAGTLVNIERSARQNVEIGGHVISGHIVGTAEVLEITVSENNSRMTFKADPTWLRFIFDKGFLAVNGASLTVAAIDRDAETFSINLIPETLARTNFALLTPGSLVNIEVESQTQVIVETVERILAERYADA